MSSFMPDETIRVRWVAEFRDEARGLQAHYRTARKAFRDAAQEQRRNNAQTMRSARDAANSMREQQRAERDQLLRLRELSRAETQMNKSIASSAKQRLAIEEGAAKRREKMVADEERLLKRRQDATAKSLREQTRAERAHAKAQDRLIEERRKRDERHDDIQAKLIALRGRRAKATTAEQKKLLRDEAQALRDRRDTERAAAAARIRDINDEIRALNERVKAARAATKAAEADAAAEHALSLRKLKDTERERVARDKAHREEIDATEKSVAARIAELEKLREKYGELEELMRGGMGGDEDVNRRLFRAQRQLNRETIISERQFRGFQKALREVASEATSMGRISQESMDRLTAATRRARVSTEEFNESTHDAGLSIKNFSSEKNREIRLVERNTTTVGRGSKVLRGFAATFRGLRNVVALSTNEMILFNRTIRLLAVPVIVAAIGLLIQAVSVLAAGATALVAALGPLVGTFAAIPALAIGAAQGMQVWNIATKNLGKSSLDLGKIISTSLTSSADDFLNMLEDLNEAPARDFAMMLRRDLAPGFTELRRLTQANIFGGLTRMIEGAAPSFGRLRDELVGTSAVLGDFFAAFGERIGSAEWGNDLEEQARRTNRWMRDLRPAAINLADGIRDITLAAGPLVDHLVALTNRFARWFAMFSSTNRHTGRFSRFFAETNHALDTTLSLLGNFSQALINIGKISYDAIGRQMLIDLRDAAVAFRQWTESAEGAQKIRDWFLQMRPAIYEMARLFRDLVVGMVQLGAEQGFFRLLREIRVDLLPSIIEMFRTVTNTFAPKLITLIGDLVRMISSMAAEGGGLTIVVDAFSMLARMITRVAESPLGPVLFYVAGITAAFRAFRYAAAVSGFTMIARAVAGLATALASAAIGANRFNAFMSRATGGAIPYGIPQNIPVGAPPRMYPTPGRAGPPGRASQFIGRYGAGIGIGAGAAAMLGGQAMGGQIGGTGAGGLLTNIGTGALVGGMVSPTPVGVGLGAAAGVLVTAFQTLRGRSNDVVSVFDRIRASGGAAAASLDKIRSTREQLPQARLDVRYAEIGMRDARAVRDQVVAEFGAGSDRAKRAELDLAQAVETHSNAVERLNTLEREHATGVENWTKRRRTAMESVLLATQRAREEQEKLGEDWQAPERRNKLKRFVDGMIEEADRLRGRGLTGIADVAQRIADVADTLGSIPRRKEIEWSLTGNWREALAAIKEFGINAPQVVVAARGNLPEGTRLRRGGGMIPGPAGAGDVVPIMASPGEGIVTNSGQQMIDAVGGSGFFNYVMQTQAPHFARGGIVGGNPIMRLLPAERFQGARQRLAEGMQAGRDPDAQISDILGGLREAGFFTPTPSSRARVNAGIIPANVPADKRAVLRRLLAVMNRVDSKDYPLVVGGGQVTPARPTSGIAGGDSPGDKGFDHAAAISYVLQQAGFSVPTTDAQGFAGIGRPGKGKWMTLWVRPNQGGSGRVYLDVLKRQFGTARDNPGGGPGFVGAQSRTDFQARHLPGFRRGGYVRRRFQTGGIVDDRRFNDPRRGTRIAPAPAPKVDPRLAGGAIPVAVPRTAAPRPAPSAAFSLSGYMGGIGQSGAGSRANVAYANALTSFFESLQGMTMGAMRSVQNSLTAQIERMRERLRTLLAQPGNQGEVPLQRQITRLQQAVEAVSYSIGFRIGRMLAALERQGALIKENADRFASRMEQAVERRGVDANSEFALSATRRTIANMGVALRAQAENLRDQLRVLVSNNADKAAQEELRKRIRETNDLIYENATQAAVNARETAGARFERRFTAAGRRVGRAESMLERQELQQRIAGTYETGGAARAKTIQQQILPNLRKQLAIARQEEAAAAKSPSIERRMAAEERRRDLELEILRRQLEAQEAIKTNTNEIKRNTAPLSFEYGGQRFTDAITEGVGI